MMGKDQELGLSLSLSFNEQITNTSASNTTSLHLNLMPSSSPNPNPNPNPNPFTAMNKKWADLFSSSDKSSDLRKDETRSFFKGIDVNSLPCVAEEEEEAGVSSPNSTVSSSSGKRSEREHTGGISDDEDAENARKKLRLSKDQSAVLEENFKEHNTLNPKQKQALAKRLGLRPRQVEVWFQNRRARTKLKQTEVDCEYLKRCCEKLTEENRRMQKEVQELRALKLSPAQMYMQMNPPTTLTMCPSCERVAAAPASNQRRPLAASATCVHPQAFAFNPWAAATPVPHRQFDALQKARS